ELLAQHLRKVQEEARRLREEVNKNIESITKETETAKQKIGEASDSVEGFWEKLAHSQALKKVHEEFQAQIEQFKGLAEAMRNAGLMTGGEAQRYTSEKDIAVGQSRANALDASIEKLTENLGILTSPEKQYNEQHLATVIGDLKKQIEEAKLIPNKAVSEMRQDELTYKMQEAQNELDKFKPIHDKINEITATIQRMTEERDSIRNGISEQQTKNAQADFATGLGIAGQYAGGNPISQAQANFLVVFEQSITGQKLTLDQAVKLLLLQSRHMDQASAMIQMAHERIGVVQRRLDQIQGQIRGGTKGPQ
ncbi:MAG: hypothetical protein KGR26_11720, partial [Cyanobacteria bacterium REEB65]|nr:hypothetical protein [Cyanobacteria bacterium REEB65]